MQWKQEYINTVKTLAKQGLSSSKIGEAMFECSYTKKMDYFYSVRKMKV